MDTPALPGLIPSAGGEVVKPRKGRPPGAVGKRSLDLGKYIEARFGGLTPGQQAAEIGMVTAKELRDPWLKAAAKAMGLPPVVVAMADKARALALHLGCEPAMAWELMRKERAEILPYVHQRRAQAADTGPERALPVIMMPAERPAAAGRALAGPEGDRIEEIQGLSDQPLP